jgi:hypothetical protein
VDPAAPVCRFCGRSREAGPVGAPGALAPPSGYPSSGLFTTGHPAEMPPPPGFGVAKRRTVNRGPLAALVVMALVVASLAAVSLRGGDSTYPEAWDPRIEPLARFVEQEHGGVFRHPVYVDFVEESSFEATSPPEQGDEAEAQLRDVQAAGMFRALGLMSGELDLGKTTTDMAADAVLAFYDDETKRITMRGTDLDASMRMTLVHELTHAMQDQHLDLGGVRASLDGDQHDGFQAIVEGDAERVAYRYYTSMSDSDQNSIADAESASAEGGASVYDAYPPTLVALFTAPYSLGHPLAELLDTFGDPDAIDQAILDPPHSSEFMLSPFDYIDGPAPQTVAMPAIAADEKEFEKGVMGPLAWYLMLEQRLGEKVALAATDGWGGDSYIAFERDGKVCVRAAIRGDTPEARDHLAATFAAWNAAMGGTAQIRAADDLLFESCDPGAAAKFNPSPDAAYGPLVLPTVRSLMAVGMAGGDVPRDRIQCASHTFAEVLPMEIVAADDGADRVPQEAIDAVRAACVDR